MIQFDRCALLNNQEKRLLIMQICDQHDANTHTETSVVCSLNNKRKRNQLDWTVQEESMPSIKRKKIKSKVTDFFNDKREKAQPDDPSQENNTHTSKRQKCSQRPA